MYLSITSFLPNPLYPHWHHVLLRCQQHQCDLSLQLHVKDFCLSVVNKTLNSFITYEHHLI